MPYNLLKCYFLLNRTRTEQTFIEIDKPLLKLTAELEKRTQAFEMRCYRRLLNISYKDHVTNEEVRRKIQAAIGEYDELLTLVKKRKLRWFGHVSRSSGLAKSGQEWTLPAQLGQLKTGQDGKGLLQIHLWCPDDLPRLWDRIE